MDSGRGQRDDPVVDRQPPPQAPSNGTETGWLARVFAGFGIGMVLAVAIASVATAVLLVLIL